MLNQDYIKLELDKILNMLSELCSNDESKQIALSLEPLTDEFEVKEEQRKTGDAFDLSMSFGSPSFYNFKNVKNSLARCRSGGRISLKELMAIASLLRQIQTISDWHSKCSEKETSLDYLFSQLSPQPYLLEKLDRSILNEEMIADGASSALLSIRQKIARAGIKLRETLNNMVKSESVKKCLQDTNITLRDGRYVLPVKSEYRGQIQGLIHDTSATGQTIFVEPMAVVEANNDIRILEAKEQEEIERIIKELCSECAAVSEAVEKSFDVCVELNLYFAKAELGIKMKAYMPVLSDGYIDLKKARHPLLDQKTAVPIDIKLGKEYRTLLITGPNTGGKTVALKTAGLLTAMAMCGLMIPAAEGSCVPVMSQILTDIGDKQSIEASLSTFSSHMTNIISIIKKADDRTLVLLDEPGTGTDPVEGAALAQSVFEELRRQHSLVMATTHYQELKMYASLENDVENASCEFDPDTLKPTYRLRIGSPGKSNAFYIASNLGMPEDMIDYAKSLIDSENTRFEEIISKLEDTQTKLEKERETARIEREKAQQLRKELETEKKELEDNRQNELERARGAAQQIIERTKAQTNALIDELDTLRKEKEKKDFSKNVSDAKSKSKQVFNKLYSDANPVENSDDNSDYVLPRPLKQGDSVYITDIGKSGIVSGKPDNSGQIYVQIGIMRTKVDIKKLRLEEKKKVTINGKQPNNSKRKNTAGKVSGSVSRSASMELDIRGYASDEGTYEMEAFIDRAVMSGMHVVTIIHGKGTGVLRNAIRQKLRSIKSVKSFRPGVYGEGEDGVTVVELK